MRIAIVGGPRTGKTQAARAVALATGLPRAVALATGLPLVSTDDFIDLGWSVASQHVADLLADGAPRIVEGVAVARALRKALRDRPEERPVDRLVILSVPKVEQTTGQRIMASGVDTVLDGILDELQALGVVVAQEPVT
jgi:hypothetical protein